MFYDLKTFNCELTIENYLKNLKLLILKNLNWNLKNLILKV